MQSRSSSGRFVKNQISNNFRKVKMNLPKEIARALYQEVEVETTEVKKRTPVSPHGGHLRGSVHQVGPFFRGNTIYSTIVAGGIAASYAIYVHEILTNFHRVGQAKYLESVIMESRAYIAARVAKRIEFNRLLA